MYRILPSCFTEDLTMHNMTSMTSHVSEWMLGKSPSGYNFSVLLTAQESCCLLVTWYKNGLGDFHWSENVPSPCSIKALPAALLKPHETVQWGLFRCCRTLSTKRFWKSSINHAWYKSIRLKCRGEFTSRRLNLVSLGTYTWSLHGNRCLWAAADSSLHWKTLQLQLPHSDPCK